MGSSDGGAAASPTYGSPIFLSPIFLSLDTCGSSGGVCLGSAHSSDLLYRELVGKTFSERLIATVSELLSEASVELPQLSAIVVVNGPGSFTGIRIGVSAAKGLAEALSIAVIGISRLELLARMAAEADALAVLDAGRGEFFVGIYRNGLREAELLATKDSLISLFGTAGLRLLSCEERVFEALREFGAELVATPTAIDALKVGATRFRAGILDDVATLDANYLRRSDQEMLARIAEHAAIKAADAGRG